MRKMRLTVKEKWSRTIAWLHSEFPMTNPTQPGEDLAIGVTIVDVPRASNSHGCAGWDHIEISSHIPCWYKLQVLLHEWAHCLNRGKEYEGPRNTKGEIESYESWWLDSHDDEWALAHGKIYRAFFVWNFGRENKRKAK